MCGYMYVCRTLLGLLVCIYVKNQYVHSGVPFREDYVVSKTVLRTILGIRLTTGKVSFPAQMGLNTSNPKA